jgi:hypothetical protein
VARELAPAGYAAAPFCERFALKREQAPSPQQQPLYTGEIVASTPIKRVNAKNPPKKIAIFVMNIPDRKVCRPTAEPQHYSGVGIGWVTGAAVDEKCGSVQKVSGSTPNWV